jgi:hypothetical protein
MFLIPLGLLLTLNSNSMFSYFIFYNHAFKGHQAGS